MLVTSGRAIAIVCRVMGICGRVTSITREAIKIFGRKIDVRRPKAEMNRRMTANIATILDNATR